MAPRRAFSLSPAVLETAKEIARTERRSVQAVVSTALRAYAKTKAAKRNGSTPAKVSSSAKRGASPTSTPLEFFNQLQDDLRDTPRSAWKKLPRDGSLNVDKYVYGKP